MIRIAPLTAALVLGLSGAAYAQDTTQENAPAANDQQQAAAKASDDAKTDDAKKSADDAAKPADDAKKAEGDQKASGGQKKTADDAAKADQKAALDCKQSWPSVASGDGKLSPEAIGKITSADFIALDADKDGNITPDEYGTCHDTAKAERDKNTGEAGGGNQGSQEGR